MRGCDFGSECPYLSECPECDCCDEHCYCGCAWCGKDYDCPVCDEAAEDV